jgi:O-acetyl-ADP-ribose deacetylase
MKVILKQGNILDVEADVLVCSANVSLNLTGGVGADIVERYGTEMQAELHEQLNSRTPHYAFQGEVFTCTTRCLPYKAVLHAVAVDPMYKSSIEIITEIVQRCLEMAEEIHAKTVALTCLASGFGDLTLEDFIKGLKPVLEEPWNIKEIYLAQIQDYRFKELQEACQTLGLIEE